MNERTIEPTEQRRKLLRSAAWTLALAAVGGAALAVPQASEAAASITVRIGTPPPPRFERVPPPRRGYVWSPGHWEVQRGRYVWVSGVWMRERPGYAFRPPQWHQRGGRWEFVGARWDRDGDGVPNRYDRRPSDPRRR